MYHRNLFSFLEGTGKSDNDKEIKSYFNIFSYLIQHFSESWKDLLMQ